MPELPDVETFKRYFDATALHEQIDEVDIKDQTVLSTDPVNLAQILEDSQFRETQRTGKYLLVKLDSGDWMAMHFGMTGNLKYFRKQDGEPDYSRVVFHFDDGHDMHYLCKRKLGRIEITDSVRDFRKAHELGKDALALSKEEFKELLHGKRGGIKSALMNQNLIAGIGNVYSDEILYQSKVHPKTKVKSLNDEKFVEIYRVMNRVLKTAIKHKAHPCEMPAHYLITHRSEGDDCPECGGKIKRIKVSGRGCYICPDCQRK